MTDETYKRCSRCGEEKPRGEFYREKRAPDGLRYECKTCFNGIVERYQERVPRRDRDREYEQANPERTRAKARAFQKRHQPELAAKQREWRKANRHKTRAHDAVKHALRKGKLTRPEACESCGKDGRIEAHHDDYAKPLDVRWLCRSCHVFADRERDE